MGGHREAFLREQGQVWSSFCVALQEGGHICLVLGGGGLESVRHACRRRTDAMRSFCNQEGKSLVERKGIGKSKQLDSVVAQALPIQIITFLCTEPLINYENTCPPLDVQEYQQLINIISQKLFLLRHTAQTVNIS